jgi:biopolymer transport protein ExbD
MASLADFDEDDDLLATINIIPFVDIVLVLLVIFMLTSATIVRASLQVELPKALSAGSHVESTLNLVYRKSGELLINGEAFGSQAAAALFVRKAAAQNPKTQAVIAADRGAPYGRVIELIDMVKREGISTFALDVERGSSAAASGEATGSP